MTSDQLTPEQRKGSEVFFGTHSSWGLGFAVDIARLMCLGLIMIDA
jgi:hypothetical protein